MSDAFFRGRQVSASRSERGLLAFKPVGKDMWTYPPETTLLYLPEETLLEAYVSPRADHSAVGFRGDFRRVDRPDLVILGPLDSEDATGLVAALAEHVGLPRLPRACRAEELCTFDTIELIEVEGLYRPGHAEGADFEGVKVSGERAKHLAAGKRYRIAGFIHPDKARFGRHDVGYSGAFLHAMEIEEIR